MVVLFDGLYRLPATKSEFRGIPMLLVEKYRPNKIEDVVGFPQDKIQINEGLPHLLFYGPPGTGKTTLAKIIIRTLGSDHIVLNASDERGIDTIRDKVKVFASTKSSSGKIKIIFLDESDHLTPDAQTSLRNLMETYSNNCRFILTANYLNRIIDPLQSRCQMLEFNNIPQDLIVTRLQYICDQEKIPYELDALKALVSINGSDIRKSVNKLEELRVGVTLDKIVQESTIALDTFRYIALGDFNTARQTYLDAHIDHDQFLRDLYKVIMKSSVPIEVKQLAIHEIAEAYKFLNQVSWKEILIENALLNIQRAMTS